MDDDNLRIRAMDFAIAARTKPTDDIIELAQRIYAFLDPQPTLTAKGADALKAHVDEIQSEQCIPPSIPHQDLGKADQSPLLDAFRRSVVLASTAEGDLVIDDDAKTRIVRPVA